MERGQHQPADHDPGVLATLDHRAPTSFYWYLALPATIGGFLFGYDTSDVGSALEFIPYHLSSFVTGYPVAVVILQMMPGSASGFDWRLMLGLGAVPAVVALGLRTRMPQSPRWLMHKGRYADTAHALQRPGVEVSQDQVRRTADQLEAADAQREQRTRWTSGVRRALALGGHLGTGAFILLSAGSVAYASGLPKTVIVMVGLDLFIASFAIGVGGTGWLLQGEVFPTAGRGRAAAVCAVADWVANFVIVQFFPSWEDTIGLAWVMMCFAALSVVAMIFVYSFVPETKNLSVEEVIDLFDGQASEAGV